MNHAVGPSRGARVWWKWISALPVTTLLIPPGLLSADTVPEVIFFVLGASLYPSSPPSPARTAHKQLRAFSLAAAPVPVDHPGRIE